MIVDIDFIEKPIQLASLREHIIAGIEQPAGSGEAEQAVAAADIEDWWLEGYVLTCKAVKGTPNRRLGAQPEDVQEGSEVILLA